MKAICSHFQRLAVLVPLVVCAAGGVSQQALAGQSDIGTSASPLGIPPGPPTAYPELRRARGLFLQSASVWKAGRRLFWRTKASI